MTKKKKEEPKFINEVGCFTTDTGIERYNVKSITELEPGTIFGAIFRYERALCVLPKLVDKDGNKVIDLTGHSNTVYFEIQGRPEDGIPMIFKKLDDYFVEDILTGIKFMIGDVDTNVNEKYKYVEGLNSSVSKYVEKVGFNIAITDFRKVPIIFDSYLYARVGEHALSNVALVVNDEFKAYYAAKTLLRKDDIIKGLQEMYEDVKTFYEEDLDQCISQLHNIALTEDFLYDKGYELKKEK